MKTSIIHAFFAIILVAAIGCKKDLTQSLTESAELQSQMLPADVQAEIDQAILEIENDYNNPPSDGVVGNRAVVYVPAGSVDALQDAIDEAGWGGKVIVESGEHWESETVVIDHTVRIIGQDGAKVYFNTSDKGFVLFNYYEMDPAIYIKNANFVWVQGLEIVPKKSAGSVGIYLERAQYARIKDNTIMNHYFGIVINENSNNSGVYDNTLINDFGVFESGMGLVNIDGRSTKIKGNYFSGFRFGVFASDSRGVLMNNEFDDNPDTGVILCTFQGDIKLPNGKALEKANSCSKWKLVNNDSHDNDGFNYFLIDGANHNFLVNNKASNAGLQDVFLAPPLIINGAPALPASNNFVVNPSNSIVYRDCGEDNTVLGGTEIPCQ